MEIGKRFTVRVLVAPVIFVILGPALGAMPYMVLGERAIFPAAVFFVFLGAYVMAGKACLVAGMLYSGICLFLWKQKPNRDVCGVVSVLVGSVAGLAGIVFRILTADEIPLDQFAASAWLIAPGMFAGAACAACANLVLQLADSSVKIGDAGTARSSEGFPGER